MGDELNLNYTEIKSKMPISLFTVNMVRPKVIWDSSFRCYCKVFSSSCFILKVILNYRVIPEWHFSNSHKRWGS